MKEAGLTHGGFYAHFRNRDELVAEAVRAAAHETGQRVFAEQPDARASLRLYLSSLHAEHPEHGCVVAALGADAPRQPAPVRKAFGEAARGLLEWIERRLRPGAARKVPSDEALELGARMVGALVLSRMVEDQELSRRILSVAAR